MQKTAVKENSKKSAKKSRLKISKRPIPKRAGRPVEHDFDSVKIGQCVEHLCDTKEEAEAYRTRKNVSARKRGYKIVTRIIPTDGKFNVCFWLKSK